MIKLLNKFGLYTKRQLEKIISDTISDTEKRVVKEQESAFLDENTMIIINGDCNTIRDITLKAGKKLVVTSTSKQNYLTNIFAWE